jgi:NAD(P)H-flavin reductase
MNRLFTSRALGAAVSATALGGIAHAETIRVGNNKNVQQIRQFENLSVKSVIQETPNVKRVVFHLPDKSIPLGFSAISAVMLKADRPEGLEKATMKPYNPVFHSTPGEFSVCVKKYPNSKMGTVVHALAPGDQLAVKFGWQQFDYQPNKFGKIGMIAGG